MSVKKNQRTHSRFYVVLDTRAGKTWYIIVYRPRKKLNALLKKTDLLHLVQILPMKYIELNNEN